MELGDLWRKCEDPFLSLMEKAVGTAKKQALRAKSEKWRKTCEAQKRVDRVGPTKMFEWIVLRIKKISKLCPEEMTTKDKITAAMRIAVLLHPEFVKELHARPGTRNWCFQKRAGEQG